jgi:predicted Holliday junction resolvase-like endonuclease
MSNTLLALFALQDQIFGVCPCCGEPFRLSEAKLFERSIPPRTWLDRIEDEKARLAELEERIKTQLTRLREVARRRGRKRAQAIVKAADRVFSPHKLHADDAKPLCHPVAYVVFDGLNSGKTVRKIMFLDRVADSAAREAIQESMVKSIRAGNIVWRELHVSESGLVAARNVIRSRAT